MSQVEVIEKQIKTLSPAEFSQLREWILRRDGSQWDKQIEQDLASGKLNHVIQEDKKEYRSGNLVNSGKGTLMRQAILYPGEDDYWVAECPSLPGCISQGPSKEEAIANLKEAIQGYIESLQQDHLPVPPERFDALVVAV